MIQIHSCFHIIILLLLPLLGLSGCGGAGDDEGDNDSSNSVIIGGGLTDVTGVISNQTGSQLDMAGWIVSLYEKETGINKTGTINGAGIFTIKAVDLSKYHGLILISPEYIVQAVFAHQSTTPGQIHSYFQLKSNIIPRLIHRGPIVNPQDIEGLTLHNNISSDANINGIPDGAEAILATSALTGLNLSTDIDADGVVNTLDQDLDADGIPNNIDSDDDNDTITDIYDDDSNGDGISDMVQLANDQYYSTLIDWLAVKYELITGADSSLSRQLSFAIQLKQNVTLPEAINIQGSPTLFAGSSVVSLNTDNVTTTQEWEDGKPLLDDGLNQDSRANDRLYARKITLGAGLIPVNQQLVFFDLIYGSGESAWSVSFPHLFPSVVLNGITGAYASDTRTVTLSGQPFGTVTDFTWNVSVYWDNSGMDVKVFVSPPVLGSATTYILPDYILDASKAYKFRINAQLRDRVLGYASYIVESPLTSF